MSKLVFNPNLTYDVPGEYTLGDIGLGSGKEAGREYVFVKVDADIDAKQLVRITDSGGGRVAAPGSSNKGDRVGIANVDIADDHFGWIQVYGHSVGIANAGITDNTVLGCQASGELDDTVPSNGALTGVHSKSTGSANGDVEVFLNRPYFT